MSEPALQTQPARWTPLAKVDTATSRRPLLLIGTEDYDVDRVMGVREAIAKRLPEHEVVMVCGGTFATEVGR